MSAGFAAYVFDGSNTAENELRKARAAEVLDLVWLDDVAVIERHHSGRTDRRRLDGGPHRSNHRSVRGRASRRPLCVRFDSRLTRCSMPR